MTCIMWLAARPPCSSGQPRVSQQRSARFSWNERRNSQRSSPAPPRALPALRLAPARLRTLIATGDVIPARHTDVVIRSRGDDFLYTVAATKEITAGADPTAGNHAGARGE